MPVRPATITTICCCLLALGPLIWLTSYLLGVPTSPLLHTHVMSTCAGTVWGYSLSRIRGRTRAAQYRPMFDVTKSVHGGPLDARFGLPHTNVCPCMGPYARAATPQRRDK